MQQSLQYPRNARELGPRSPSLATLELKIVLFRPVLGLAMVKHIVSCIYFTLMCFLYATTSPADLRAIEAYAPNALGVFMGCFAALHGYGLTRTCRIHASRSKLWTNRWHSLDRFLSPSSQLTLFHLINVACQSYQAYHASHYLVDSVNAIGFVVVVALNCIVTPWFLHSKHKVVRHSVVPLVDSFFGFFLSTLFPSYVLAYPAMCYNVGASHTQGNDFTTRLILASRCFLVTSPLDLVTKTVIQFSSFASLRKLVEFTHVPKVVRKIDPRITSSRTSSLIEHFQLEFHHKRLHFAYTLGAAMWGIYILAVSTTATLYARHTCPDTCVLAFAPWWTSTCQCAFFVLNCALKNVTGDSIDSFLQPDALGRMLFFMDIRRCALPRGIPLATLAPFQRLYGLHVLYSNMSEWSPLNTSATTLPDSLADITIRYSNLTAVPVVLTTTPACLQYLTLEGATISEIPDSFFKAWVNVSQLVLNAINLTTIPLALTGMVNVQFLQLKGNNLTSIPPTWHPTLPRLELLDLSANAFTDAPWSVAQDGMVTLELSSNPIASIPASVDAQLITKANIVLDDTPYCATPGAAPCLPKCSSMCQVKLIGDGRCDWPCLSAACGYDDGDCDSYGFV
ncbi:Aste57867_8455 [Aphanomyces stellatus]|uniref:Aste57867_8455 protein n=1 Tax=Aphanomyces stellatus TaxID=120398 RepID=A0A485KKD5_9STRA|nr:hypothetical protein As57867_008423 [Aphanomyces stellatus]VFT85341.1 Aste57867_8455 [Aphanomyces stellatus]